MQNNTNISNPSKIPTQWSTEMIPDEDIQIKLLKTPYGCNFSVNEAIYSEYVGDLIINTNNMPRMEYGLFGKGCFTWSCGGGVFAIFGTISIFAGIIMLNVDSVSDTDIIISFILGVLFSATSAACCVASAKVDKKMRRELLKEAKRDVCGLANVKRITPPKIKPNEATIPPISEESLNSQSLLLNISRNENNQSYNLAPLEVVDDTSYNDSLSIQNQ